MVRLGRIARLEEMSCRGLFSQQLLESAVELLLKIVLSRALRRLRADLSDQIADGGGIQARTRQCPADWQRDRPASQSFEITAQPGGLQRHLRNQVELTVDVH